VPTVLRLAALRVVIYPNDHRPAHVHVIGRDREAVFSLNCPTGPVCLRVNYSFRRRELAPVKISLTKNLASLCSQWEEIHGIAR
jgi:hypothetical protein